VFVTVDVPLRSFSVPARSIDIRKVKEAIALVYSRSSRERPLAWGDLDDDTPLYSLEEGEESLGLDSLDAVEIACELEEAFDVVLPTEIDPAELRTVRQIVEVLGRLVTEQHGTAP
jgi:acyl carrier protein